MTTELSAASTLPSPTTERLIAVVDDHGVARAGFHALLASEPDLTVVGSGRNVREINAALNEGIDLVVLDLRLSDGSHPADNVRSILNTGTNVLILTGGENIDDLRAVARAGAIGIVRKSENDEVLIDAVRAAANGQPVASIDWAAALDSDEHLADAGLSKREQEILTLYASGEKAQSVAYLTNLSRDTVSDYISRIRAKYAKVGRVAATKIDLHVRAQEDGLLPRNPRS